MFPQLQGARLVYKGVTRQPDFTGILHGSQTERRLVGEQESCNGIETRHLGYSLLLRDGVIVEGLQCPGQVEGCTSRGEMLWVWCGLNAKPPGALKFEPPHKFQSPQHSAPQKRSW